MLHAPLARLAIAALLITTSCLTAQSTLAELESQFQRTWQQSVQAAGGRLGMEEAKRLMADQVEALRKFLDGDPQGDDPFNGRLMLVDRLATIGDFDKAKSELQKLEVSECPALILLTSADLARRLGLTELGTKWKELALLKEAPFEDRMTMGLVLMTVFVDVEGGEAVFAKAMAAAKDDEERARVAWYRSLAIREREDLPEGSYEKELEKLARDHEGTRFGKIAKDRIEAMSYRVGSTPLPLEIMDAEGKAVTLASYRGKVVLLDFWASWAAPWQEGTSTLVDLKKAHGDDFVVLGFCLDEDRESMDATLSKLRLPWRQAWCKGGWEADLPLRYFVENVPHTVIIGRDGKIAALNHHVGTPSSRRDLTAAVERALGTK